MDKTIRAAIFRRAAGTCECGCGKQITEETGRADHFFGRAKSVESVETVWALSVACDEAKTQNRPGAALWLARFAQHALRHGYRAQAERALMKIEALSTKGLTA